jgi:hypothetical protein
MNLEKYIVVSGIPGVHKLVSTRGNGLIIDDRNEGRTRFVPIRQNPVTPLATIGIYIFNAEGQDTIPLGEVFQKMLDAIATTPPVDTNSKPEVLRAYFTAILPDHDQDQVHINDIKKCIKWFNFMQAKGVFEEIKKDAAEIAAVAAAAEAELAVAEAPAVVVADSTPEVVAEAPAPKKKKAAKA